jgi:hypothetical protein
MLSKNWSESPHRYYSNAQLALTMQCANQMITHFFVSTALADVRFR